MTTLWATVIHWLYVTTCMRLACQCTHTDSLVPTKVNCERLSTCTLHTSMMVWFMWKIQKSHRILCTITSKGSSSTHMNLKSQNHLMSLFYQANNRMETHQMKVFLNQPWILYYQTLWGAVLLDFYWCDLTYFCALDFGIALQRSGLILSGCQGNTWTTLPRIARSGQWQSGHIAIPIGFSHSGAAPPLSFSQR